MRFSKHIHVQKNRKTKNQQQQHNNNNKRLASTTSLTFGGRGTLRDPNFLPNAKRSARLFTTSDPILPNGRRKFAPERALHPISSTIEAGVFMKGVTRHDTAWHGTGARGGSTPYVDLHVHIWGQRAASSKSVRSCGSYPCPAWLGYVCVGVREGGGDSCIVCYMP